MATAVAPPRSADAGQATDKAGRLRRIRVRDEWLVALIAAILSIAFFRWYAVHGLTVAFNDARSREMIARRVLASRTPGLAQLGATWLPLPAMLMLPLIWNDTLFSDGIAGSLPSMAAYVVAGVYLYRSGRLVADSRAAGWVAASIFLLNPSILYMQATPMSEIPSLSAWVVAVYYALSLMRSSHALDIVKCAIAVAAGTLIRYENWVLGIALVPVIAVAAWRRRGHQMVEAWTMLYSLLAFAGCGAWIVYNAVIFHDPLLSFFYGQSDHKYYANTPASLLPAKGHPAMALKMYGLTVVDNVGWPVVAAAAGGLILFVWRNRLRLTGHPLYITLLPFGFYCLVLYKGINTESLPQLGTGTYYNVRFGLLMIPALALFASYLTSAGRPHTRGILAGVCIAATVTIGIAGPIRGTPIVLREALAGYGGDTRSTGQAMASWFSAHYHGGNILYTYVNDSSMMFYLLTDYEFPDRAFITDANGPQFARALARPQRWVRWIVLNSSVGNNRDPIWLALHRHTGWRRYFVLREVFPAHQSARGRYGRVEIFERRSAAARGRGYSAAGPQRGGLALRPRSAHGFHQPGTYASLAIDGNPSTAWKTEWYIGSPVFGGLRSGGGLILDMGRPVRLSSVQVRFGPVRGAHVQIKIGNRSNRSAATVRDMITVARATDVRGTHMFTVRGPATGRYVLIWFTRLPPMAGRPGTYRAEIFAISVRGYDIAAPGVTGGSR